MSKKLTTEEFIEKARKVHGDKYDYSDTCYRVSNEKLLIHCPIHGIFEQVASKHLFGSGCPKCAHEKQALSQEEFIERLKNIYGALYSYEKIEYVNFTTKVCVTCVSHGDFLVRPSNLLQGHGCPRCGAEKKANRHRVDLEDFITRSKEQHGDKYDYSQITELNGVNEKIPIDCDVHGVFWQSPSIHMNGCGCPKCGIEKAANSRQLTTEEFIEKARKVHGDKYEYADSYCGNHIKLHIACPEHGTFLQTPASHLQGNGCPKCKADKISEKRKMTTDKFIKFAREKHGEKWDYSCSCYMGTNHPIEIRCEKHGIFEITPHKHLTGQGCPICSKEERVHKMIETRRRNGTLSTSGSEQELLGLLRARFGKNDIEYQYKTDSRYPFSCDFYICSLDLFIELNASQFHNRHWFDENNPKDIEQLKMFQEKAARSDNNQYIEIINTWTRRDPLKRKTAEENNLNYLVFWDNDLTDAKEWLATLPDKQDEEQKEEYHD